MMYCLWKTHNLQSILELEIKETRETAASSSYLYLYIDSGKLTTRLYDKRDNVNFLDNFPFLNSNIPSAPAYAFTYHS